MIYSFTWTPSTAASQHHVSDDVLINGVYAICRHISTKVGTTHRHPSASVTSAHQHHSAPAHQHRSITSVSLHQRYVSLSVFLKSSRGPPPASSRRSRPSSRTNPEPRPTASERQKSPEVTWPISWRRGGGGVRWASHRQKSAEVT